MAIDKINTTDDQNAETNVNWIQNGERANETNLNRPAKQVADVVNNLIDDVDLQINAEATTRGVADAVLQSNINAEATERGIADAVLQSNINAEETARINADAGLDIRISALENAPVVPTPTASEITTVDEFGYSNGGNVQDVLDDIDSAIATLNTSLNDRIDDVSVFNSSFEEATGGGRLFIPAYTDGGSQVKTFMFQWLTITDTIGSFSGTYIFPLSYTGKFIGVTTNQYGFSPNGWVLRARITGQNSIYLSEDTFGSVGQGGSTTIHLLAWGYV